MVISADIVAVLLRYFKSSIGNLIITAVIYKRKDGMAEIFSRS